MITVREFFSRAEDEQYYEVDVVRHVARAAVSKLGEAVTDTDEEIQAMISKTQKQKALEKRMIASGLVVVLDLVGLGILWKRYRAL